MTTKTVDLSLLIRDPNDPSFIMGNQNATGTTDDEGVTIVIPLGYLTDIQSAPLSDLTYNVIQPVVPMAPTSVVSRTDDYEANTSTIVFSYT